MTHTGVFFKDRSSCMVKETSTVGCLWPNKFYVEINPISAGCQGYNTTTDKVCQSLAIGEKEENGRWPINL